jgi:hypothetical protein
VKNPVFAEPGILLYFNDVYCHKRMQASGPPSGVKGSYPVNNPGESLGCSHSENRAAAGGASGSNLQSKLRERVFAS